MTDSEKDIEFARNIRANQRKEIKSLHSKLEAQELEITKLRNQVIRQNDYINTTSAGAPYTLSLVIAISVVAGMVLTVLILKLFGQLHGA